MREHKQVVGVAICAIAAAFSTMALAGAGQTFALNLGGGGAQEWPLCARPSKPEVWSPMA